LATAKDKPEDWEERPGEGVEDPSLLAYTERVIRFLIQMHPKGNDKATAGRLRNQFESASEAKKTSVVKAAISAAKREGRLDLLEALLEF